MGMFTTRAPADGGEMMTAEAEVEGEIREFVRRDTAALRGPSEPDGAVVANNIGSLLQRVSGQSVQEIDSLIAELQTLRERLRLEGELVPRCNRPGSSRTA
jgi:hypothetical protein